MDKEERLKMYRWIEYLEVNMLELPIPDIKIFLHVPYDISLKLKQKRSERPDENEKNKKHLIDAETAYLELADIYNFKKIECFKDDNILTIEQINQKIYDYIKANIG